MAGTARIFISYSSKDTDRVDRLKAALANAGVAVWLDHEQLTPGTPNWEVKVREGIAQATHVVYAASPDAALSPYVVHEIEMARGNGKTVLPFWIRGEQWYDCAPMGWYRSQYTDGRDSAYDVGLSKLLTVLGVVAPVSRPAPQPAPQPQQHSAAAKSSASIDLEAAANVPSIITLGPSVHSTPDVPARLARLGFRGISSHGTPAIIPPLVRVPAGHFLMGSEYLQDQQARDNEIPQHRVELANFEIGKYPVTVAEYALAVKSRAVSEPHEWQGISWQTQLQRADHPVVHVSWNDATKYAAWMVVATGQSGWRLPSEAQWEKAARWDAQRGVSRVYPWGNSFDKARCNTRDSGIGTTTPIGSYPADDGQRSGASPYGAEDMAGNVLEWTSTLFERYWYRSNDGRENQASAGSRVLRGGSWAGISWLARAACRDRNFPDNAGNSFGFRLVRE